MISDHIETVDSIIAECYSRRGLTAPLLKHIEEIKKGINSTETPKEFKTPEAQNIAKEYVKPLLEIFKKNQIGM